jgi:hypothetical protein
MVSSVAKWARATKMSAGRPPFTERVSAKVMGKWVAVWMVTAVNKTHNNNRGIRFFMLCSLDKV